MEVAIGKSLLLRWEALSEQFFPDITVKLINNESFTINIDPHASIVAVKGKLKETIGIAENRQRLIYRGQVLKDECFLHDYQIRGGHVLHMVARPEIVTNYNSADSSSSTPANASSPDDTSVSSLANIPLQNSSSSDVASTDPPSLDHIRQGLLTLQTILSTMRDQNFVSSHCEGKIRDSSPEDKKYAVGQWVDVKDTVSKV